jgi:hypothetical protein
MNYGDPVLQRSMFRGPSVQPSVGLGSGTSADENAQALRNMFSPTVSISEPASMIQQEQQPVQSFQTGGLATKIGASALDIATLPYQLGVGFFGGKPTSLTPFYDEYVRRARGETGEAPPSPVQRTGAALGDVLSSPVSVARGIGSMIDPTEISPPTSYTPRLDVLRQAEAARGQRSPATPPPPAAPPAPAATSSMAEFIGGPTPGAPGLTPAAASAPEQPPAERPKGALELTLEGIRAERARSAEDKRQNALLALMQAGLAMAGGRSPNAISNIAAGGQAGIAAFAGMEKDRRAEQAGLRREETALLIERERMRAQEERAPEAIRTYASLGGWDPSKGREGFDEAVRKGIQVSKSLEKEPETVRLFQALGGGDLMKGFEIYNADKKLQAAQAILKDITATEDDKKAANEYIRGQLMRARTGGGSFEGFSARRVP